MMYGGKLVLQAAANVTSSVTSTVTSTVSSTVNTVASVTVGSRKKSTEHHKGGLLAQAKEKYIMTVKCTPNKDANTTSNLSVKSGFLMKKNEQGHYQRRFVCIVPHMFLYYYENEMSETPRGIIDLELLDNISREPDNMLKLATLDEEHWRSFYFQDDDDETITEWMTTIIRDRYHNVCEERNAYQAMQSEMTGAIDKHSSLAKRNEAQSTQLAQTAEKFKHDFQEAYNYLQIALVELGISEEEMSRLSDVNKLGTELKHRIIELKEMFQTRLEENNQRFDLELQEQQTIIADLRTQIEHEQVARRNLDALCLQQHREQEQYMKDSELQFGNLQINLQLAIASKEDIEAKANVLHDQKRLLVKEVKQLRKKQEEQLTLLTEMKHMNAQLADTGEMLRKEVQELEKYRNEHQLLQQQQQQLQGHGGTSSHSPHSNHSSSSNSSMMDRLFSDHHSLLHRVHTAHTNTAAEDEDHDATTATPSTHNNHKARQMSIATDDGEERNSWDLPSSVALKELGSLLQDKSPSHRNSVNLESAANKAAATPAATNNSDHSTSQTPQKRSSLSMFSKVMFGDHATPSTTSTATASTLNTSTTSHTNTNASSTATNSSYLGTSLLSSVFGSVVGTNTSSAPPPPTPHSSSGVSVTPATTVDNNTSTTAHDNSDSTSDYFASPFISSKNNHDDGSSGASEDRRSSSSDDVQNTAANNRLPVVMRLTCLRCKGSVEGPKYSTCKCDIPALSPEDLQETAQTHTASTNSSSSSGNNQTAFSVFSGMLSKGSSLAGGLAKVTTSSVEGLMSYTNNPMGSNSSSSSSSANTNTSSNNTNNGSSSSDVSVNTHTKVGSGADSTAEDEKLDEKTTLVGTADTTMQTSSSSLSVVSSAENSESSPVAVQQDVVEQEPVKSAEVVIETTEEVVDSENDNEPGTAEVQTPQNEEVGMQGEEEEQKEEQEEQEEEQKEEQEVDETTL